MCDSVCVGNAELYVSHFLSLSITLTLILGNPKEWRRHLDGCAYLIQAAEINGFSGKEEQALFWCFARMDVCGGLISEEETIIPIHNWTPKTMSPHEASQLFLASKANFDTYANYTVYLCAQTVGVVFGASKHHHPSCMSCHYLDGDTYVDRWMGLLDRVEGGYEQRPCQMKSIFSVSTPGGKESSFPTVIYGNGAASMFVLSLSRITTCSVLINTVSGNQLYHVCALLLLQGKPKTLPLSRKPVSIRPFSSAT